MDTCAIISEFQNIQGVLSIISMVNLTEYLWPPEAKVKDGASFDFIIIGAGTAGSVIANRLTENKSVNVLLIEAGGDPPIHSLIPSLTNYLKGSPYDWNTSTEKNCVIAKCHENSKPKLVLGKMLGGSSSLNYMVYTRGSSKDYQNWANITKDHSWAWNSVLPYFKKSEQLIDTKILNSPDGPYHGTTGNIKVKSYNCPETKNYFEAYKELGHKVVLDVNGKTSLGVTEPLYTIANGIRQSTAYAYLKPIKNRSNLHVLRNTTAIKIIINSNKKAIGVKVLTRHDKIIIFKAKKEVIVSAGAINTPQLLMLSGIGPKKDLERKNVKSIVDLPVGKNYQNTISVTLYISSNQTRKMSEPKSPQEIINTAILGFIALNKKQNYPDYEIYSRLEDGSNKLIIYSNDISRYRKEIYEALYKKTKDKSLYHVLLMNKYPRSRGQVYLRSKDFRDAPLVRHGLFSDEVDLDNHVRYIKHFLRILNTSSFRKMGAEFVDPTPNCRGMRYDSDEYWRCYLRCMINPGTSYSGTCAMGSVVDSRLNVYNVTNLRVADASIMPSPIRAYINAGTVMIAEKAADMIKEDYHLQ